MAEQAFKTSATGERLFYRSGPWSRPYIIPDAATEQRLLRKNVWMLRVLLGGMIIVQSFLIPYLVVLCPKVFREPYWFLVYLVVMMVVFWLTGRAVFAGDLKRLQRAQVRLHPRLFYGEMTRRHSRTGLALGFVGSLLFVAWGIWMLSEGEGAIYPVGDNYSIGVLAVVFFGLCAVAWGYALYLKLAMEADK